MGLDALIRSALATAKTLTADLQVTVTHAAWTGVDGYGLDTFATAVNRSAIVEHRQKLFKTPGGEEKLSQAHILFLEPVKANGTTGRTEPIDPRDVLTLPDGTTGPILSVQGLLDPTTDHPYYADVWLG